MVVAVFSISVPFLFFLRISGRKQQTSSERFSNTKSALGCSLFTLFFKG
jgi:hypothetical protein